MARIYTLYANDSHDHHQDRESILYALKAEEKFRILKDNKDLALRTANWERATAR